MAVFRQFFNSALIWLLGIQMVWAACPSRTYTYVSGQVISPTQVTTNEDNLYTYACAVDTFADGSIVNADLTDNTIASGKILDGTIVNADVSSSAAIAYSKLNLTGAILNADLVASAGIPYSKLSFSNNIVAGDIATGAVDVVDMAATGTPADDKAFIADSSTAGTWRTVPNCVAATSALQYTQSSNTFSCGTIAFGVTSFVGSTTYDVSTVSGTVSVTGFGFQPSTCQFEAGIADQVQGSFGFVDSASTDEGLFTPNTGGTSTDWELSISNSITIVISNGNRAAAQVSTFGADGLTWTWTKTGSPTGTARINYRCFK